MLYAHALCIMVQVLTHRVFMCGISRKYRHACKRQLGRQHFPFYPKHSQCQHTVTIAVQL